MYIPYKVISTYINIEYGHPVYILYIRNYNTAHATLKKHKTRFRKHTSHCHKLA